MNVLFLLISLFSVSGKQVVASGDVPYSVTCTYSQTGTRSGQMTKDNSATFVISGFDGYSLRSLTLQMHSNTASGAGSLRVTVAGDVLWAIPDAPFSSIAWAGQFSSDWVSIQRPISQFVMPDGQELRIDIQASANSLYIASVAVEYDDIPPSAYTVSFDTHTTDIIPPSTEQSVGRGVLLPNYAYDDGTWLFHGWVTMPVTTDIVDRVYKPGEYFYPTANTTLHAVYADNVEDTFWYPAEEVVDGAYIMCLYIPSLNQFHRAYGAVTDGVLYVKVQPTVSKDGFVGFANGQYDNDEVYILKSVADSTFTITHSVDGKRVALGTGSKFKTSTTNDNGWTFTHADSACTFILSATIDLKKYDIASAVTNNATYVLRPTSYPEGSKYLMFFPISQAFVHQTSYTSFPLGNAIQDVCIPNPSATVDAAFEVDCASFVLRIKDGQKYLIPKH